MEAAEFTTAAAGEEQSGSEDPLNATSSEAQSCELVDDTAAPTTLAATAVPPAPAAPACPATALIPQASPVTAPASRAEPAPLHLALAEAVGALAPPAAAGRAESPTAVSSTAAPTSAAPNGRQAATEDSVIELDLNSFDIDFIEGFQEPVGVAPFTAHGSFREFDVVINKLDAGVGLDVRREQGGLLIKQVKEGPCMEWNSHIAAQQEDPLQATLRQVMRGDRIIGVNGIRSSCDDLLKEIKALQTLTFTLSRRVDFGVQVCRVDRAREKLGLNVVLKPQMVGIQSLSPDDESVMKRWNLACDPDYEIRGGDAVIECNGARGDAKDILQRLCNDAELNIVVRRGALAEFRAMHPVMS